MKAKERRGRSSSKPVLKTVTKNIEKIFRLHKTHIKIPTRRYFLSIPSQSNNDNKNNIQMDFAMKKGNETANFGRMNSAEQYKPFYLLSLRHRILLASRFVEGFFALKSNTFGGETTKV